MKTIPWHDEATLVRQADALPSEGGRIIVAEGPLHRLVALVEGLAAIELQRHFIALPDRQAAPFRFDGDAIAGLLGRTDRPGARWGVER